ncbi:MAG: rhamnogalacturonan lyase [Ruminococcus sp.]|nr:rhamnogalacturonan lyase [Ruminococcus sp.]
MKHEIIAWITAAIMCASMTSFFLTVPETSVVSASNNTYQVEYLDRGITAVTTDSSMLVSWRFLASDSDTTVFNLYRNDILVYTSNADEATCYLDADGTAGDTYRVDTLAGDSVTSSNICTLTSEGNYFDIDLEPPTATISGVTYSPNDCSVGDVDGDGTYEIFLKWDPSNSKDNSQSGTTDKVYIDCYKLDGTRLWRIDLGINIRADAHYTQFYVADFDLDGYAEMTCKTADGTIDGVGNIIGDSTVDYRNSKGYILSGPEYYTLFDGLTGEALDTVDYEPARGTVSSWGDSYGNRVDRFWGTVAYLDGVTPSVVTGRGYYTRLTATAYNVVNKKLVKVWSYDSGTSSSGVGYGDGNHNSMAADVDGDGKQEIITGATCIDDDRTILWNTNTGHGDAMHLGDFLPDRDGLELWVCHEESPYGVTLFDAATGETIFHVDGSSDTGRCCADNVWVGNDGAEFWGLNYDVYDGDGNLLDMNRPAINFLCYWDGDLEREILDGYTDTAATVSKVTESGSITTLMTTDGYYTCNTTKGTPYLSADLFGDWREEIICRAADGNSIRIYSTTYDTDYRIQTLMQDPQYRVQVSAQNTAYNQPPHASFYLGSDEVLP